MGRGQMEDYKIHTQDYQQLGARVVVASLSPSLILFSCVYSEADGKARCHLLYSQY
jgi:hypothetical protein